MKVFINVTFNLIKRLQNYGNYLRYRQKIIFVVALLCSSIGYSQPVYR